MNMLPRFAVDPDTDGNPNAPVCGYCNRTQAQHDPNDHVFDAVGGSLSAIDWRNGPPPEFVHSSWEYSGKCLLIILLCAACWWGLIKIASVAGNAIHLLHSYT